jgi:hypothetical protein
MSVRVSAYRQNVSSVADKGLSLIHNLNANIDKGTELRPLHVAFLTRQLFADTNKDDPDLWKMHFHRVLVNTKKMYSFGPLFSFLLRT